MELATEETKRNPLKIPKKLRDALNSLELPDLYSLLSDIEGYESPLVDINQFLEDKNYLGNILKDERGNSKIYPVWQEALNEVFPNPYFSPFTECISGDTIVDLLDGRSLTMREIHSLSKEQLYTISYDTSTKSFVPGKIKCSKSNGNKKVFRITLDNGKYFEATDNHLILARDNKYYKVADLEVGDSLMPYNIKLSPRGYRMVMDTTSAKYRHLCTVMNEWKHGPILPGYMTHHKNFNKLDDRPHNLVTLTKDQHFIYHCVVNHNKWKDPVKAEQMRQRLREVHKIRFSDPKEKDRVSKHFKKLWKDDRSKLLEGIKKGHDNVKLRAQTDDSFAAKIKHTSIANISKYNADPNTIGDRIKRLDRGRDLLWGDPRYADARETISQKTRKHMLDGKAKMMNQKAIAKRRSDPALQEKHLAILANRNNNPDFQFKTRRNKILKQAYARYLDSGVIDYKNYDTVIKYFGSIKEYERSVKEYNHKIVSIEYIGYKDVYDLEINNNCHNFVLNAGVIVHNCAFTGPIGAGKCQRIGTLIQMADGSRKKIEDIVPSDKLLCLDNNLKINTTIVLATEQQEQECFKLTLRDGRNVTASDNHPFLAFSGWKLLRELRIGEHVAVPRILPINAKKDVIRECEAELIGMFLGDGNFINMSIYVHCDDTGVLERINKIAKEFDDGLAVNIYNHNSSNAYRISITNNIRYNGGVPNSLKDFFRNIDIFDMVGADKYVPDCVINGSDKIIIACLRGLFATDGSINVSRRGRKNGKNDRVDISFSNKSEKMIYQIQHMLLRFGILSRVRRRITKNSKTPEKRFTNWTLEVITRDSRLKFLEVIGDYNTSIVNTAKELLDGSFSNNVDLVPKEVRDYIREKKGRRPFREITGCRDEIKHAGLMRDKVAKAGIALNDKYLYSLGNSDIFWDEVVSIEPVGMHRTVDIQTEPIGGFEPNFIANDIIVHNSFVGRMILFYDLYKLLMIKNPFDKYGMVSSDMIILALFTANLALADLVLYRPFREVIRQSPFFYGRMIKKNKLSGEKGEILFPNNVSIVAGSRFTHALGLAIFSGMLDEASFQIQSANTNQAYDSYLSMSRRMESRFMDYGGTIPGHLILISSKKDENAFLEKHIETNRTKDNFIVFDKPIWEIKRHTGIYSGITFPVFTGSALQSPRILDDTSIGKYPADKILQVPVEYKQRFIEDIQRSLMEIAGSTTVSNTKYIVQPEVITKSVKLVHCVHTPEIIIGFDDDVRIIEFIDTNKLRLYLGILETSPRYVHIDIGITHDALGFAMSAVCGAREVQRFDVEAIQEQSSGIVMRNEPIIRTELAISIRSLTQVPLWKIRDLITDLTELGFPITDVTCDSYQSTDTLQIMETMGYNTEVYSVDTDKKVAHIAFRNALYEGRSELPENPILIKELTELVDQGKKFDHPTGGCFVGDTRIPLLDGTYPMISELDGKEVWVFSCRSDGTIVPGKARGRLSKHVTELVDIVLDSGAIVRCTTDHLLMLRNGTYKEASSVIPHVDRIMPIAIAHGVNGGGYTRVCNSTYGKVLTHHMVIKGLGINIPPGYIVHHKNRVRYDNRPENLEVIKNDAHSYLHGDISDDLREKMLNGLMEYNKKSGSSRMIKQGEGVEKWLGGLDNDFFKQMSRSHPKFRSDITIDKIREASAYYCISNANMAGKYLECGRNVILRVLRDNGYMSWDNFLSGIKHSPRAARFQFGTNPSLLDLKEAAQQDWVINVDTAAFYLRCDRNSVVHVLRQNNMRTWNDFVVAGNNHKVIAILPVTLAVPVPVYDLEVDEYHNFALSCGIFVHNSKDISDAVIASHYRAFTRGKSFLDIS